MTERFVFLCVGLLLAMAAISIDSILPALPQAAQGLGVDMALVQQLIPAFMFGYGFGQLAFGPISDCVGRRRALIVGMSVYLGGTAFCLLADGISWLMVGRVIQGIGAGAGQTIGRAIMRDRFSGPALARNMAMAVAIFAVGPILAPIVGAWLAEFGGWRSIFFAMAAFALTMLLLFTRLQESLRQPDPNALRPTRLWRNALTVLRHPQSRYFLLLAGISFSAIVTFLASMPRLFGEGLGVQSQTFAYFFALGGFGIVAGQFINRAAIVRFGTVWSIGAGAGLVMFAAMLAVVLDLSGLLTPNWLVLTMFAFNLGFLSIYSNAVSLVIDPHGSIAGFAASLAGLSASLIGSSVASFLIPFIGPDAWRWGVVETGVASIVLIAVLVWSRKEKSRPNFR